MRVIIKREKEREIMFQEREAAICQFISQHSVLTHMSLTLRIVECQEQIKSCEAARNETSLEANIRMVNNRMGIMPVL
jgi:hypothetical protein